MARVAPYYSAQEANKPVQDRVHHNDDTCKAGRDIRPNDKRSGTGGYRLCGDCK